MSAHRSLVRRVAAGRALVGATVHRGPRRAGGHRAADSAASWASLLPGLSRGSLYSLTMAVAAVACALGILGGRRWASMAFPLLLSLHIGVFVPVLAQDAPVAAVVILWNLLLLGDSLFSLSVRNPRGRGEAGRRRRHGRVGAPWISRYGDAARHLLIVAVLATTAVGGFRLTESSTAHAICACCSTRCAWRRRRSCSGCCASGGATWIALVVLLALGLPPALTLRRCWRCSGVPQAGVLALMLARSQVFADLLQSFYTGRRC
jgi:trk system potassium uptake protein TrkH